MMRRRGFLIMRIALVLGAVIATVLSALPVARNMAGVVVLEIPPLPARATATQRDPVDLAPILEFAPFGRPATLTATESDPKTELPDMQLKGIVVSSSRSSVAIIEVAGTADFFRKGDPITDSFELSLIDPDFVELRDGQRKITLTFDDNSIHGETDETKLASQDEGPTLFERLSHVNVVPKRYEKPQPPETTAEYIDYWRGRIRKNPQAVLDEIGLKPTTGGYVIADRHDVGVRLAGLKSGDLVRSVNGLSVGNPDDDRRFFDRIATSGQARLEVERGGKILTMSFPLR